MFIQWQRAFFFFWWLFLILNALHNPVFEANEMKNQQTLCKLKPTVQGQGGFSSKDIVRSWSPKQLLHLFSLSLCQLSALTEGKVAPAMQSGSVALFYVCIVEQCTRAMPALDKLLIKASTWLCVAWGSLLAPQGSWCEVTYGTFQYSSPLREFSLLEAAGRA